jgi:GT2 family glycosyltransferase
MSHNIDLCIVIPTFNRKKQLAILLEQLKTQQVVGLKCATIVVVDGSKDGTIELLSLKFPDIIVILGDGNWWFTRSLNEGCKYAIDKLNSKLILTLNDDVQLPDNYLKEIIRNYNESDRNSIIGSSSYSLTKPRMITFSGFSRENIFSLKYYKYIASYTYMEPGKLTSIVSSVTLPTRGLLVPAIIMKEVNYLDEKTFPQYASDYDFVLRAAKKGANIFVSYDAYVYEDMKLTSQGNPRLAKSFYAYVKNIFFNKFSSDYFPNRIIMAWRFGVKVLFPLYFLTAIIAIPYIYSKYKFRVNKNL